MEHIYTTCFIHMHTCGSMYVDRELCENPPPVILLQFSLSVCFYLVAIPITH